MNDEVLNTEQRQAIGTLLSELRADSTHGFRWRQGESWFAQRVGRGDTGRLVAVLTRTGDAVDRIKNEDLPDELLDDTAMLDFLGFVDAEASRNWTQAYDIAAADLIIEGFVDAARAGVLRAAR
ncbi:MAG: hypothetical protein KDK24_16390 [Pseudooceanicola sp.]|nr:hypothetical protein [Pseudooceanicola sp.]